MNKTYLGDSVYAEQDDNCPWQLILTTENGYGASNTIVMEPEVYAALVCYVRDRDDNRRKDMSRQRAEQERR